MICLTLSSWRSGWRESRRLLSSSVREALREIGGQPGIKDLLLGGFPVVFNTTEADQVSFGVVDDIAGPWVTVAWLTYRPDVDEILEPRLNFNQFGSFLTNAVSLHKDPGHMGMSVETDIGDLMVEVGGRIKSVRDVAPGPGVIES